MRLLVYMHSHLPYYVQDYEVPGLFQLMPDDHLVDAILECYLPLGRMLERVREEATGSVGRVTIGFSGCLLDQLQRPLVRQRAIAGAEQKAALAGTDAEEFENEGQVCEAAVARTYAAEYVELGRSLREDATLSSLLRAHTSGVLELGATAFSHAYLPALMDKVGVVAVAEQVARGLDKVAEVFGTRPKVFWLPECGFAPGLEGVLKHAGVTTTLVDASGLRAAGRPPISVLENGLRVAKIDRDANRAFWGSNGAIPSHDSFREFFHWHPGSRLKYRRITDVALTCQDKQPYDLERANAGIRIQLERFLRWLAHERKEETVVLAFDTELLGHWWREGIEFLRLLLCEAARFGVEVGGIGDGVGAGEALPRAQLLRSSWGDRADDRVWIGAHSAEYWHAVQHVVNTRKGATRRAALGVGPGSARLQQLEDALLCSDWPFQLYFDREADYARRKIAWLSVSAAIASGCARPGDGDLAEVAVSSGVSRT